MINHRRKKAAPYSIVIMLVIIHGVQALAQPVILSVEPSFSTNTLLISGASFGEETFAGSVSIYVPAEGTISLQILSFDPVKQELIVSLPSSLSNFPGTHKLTVSGDLGAASVDLGIAGSSDGIPWGNITKMDSSLADLMNRNFDDLQNIPSTVDGYNISDAVTLSGSQVLFDKTFHGSSLSGTTTLLEGAKLDLYCGPAVGYFTPLVWSSGSSYSLSGGRSSYQGISNHLGSFQYNSEMALGDVNFGLGLESRFQNVPYGVDSEFYYFWNSPDRSVQRRVFQSNVSWGPEYGATESRPTGWAQWTFNVNKFGVGNGAPFTDQFLINFDSDPATLFFVGNAQFGGAMEVRGSLTTYGSKNTLNGDTTISAGSLLLSNRPNPLLLLRPAYGDSAIQLSRNNAQTEYIKLGAAGGGTHFAGITNSFVIDVVAPSEPQLRPILGRKSFDGGKSFSTFLKFDPEKSALAVGPNAGAADLSGLALSVTGKLMVNGGAPVARLTHGTIRLISGSANVGTSLVSSTSRIFLTAQEPVGNIGVLYVGSRSAGASFIIRSSSELDNSLVAWLIVEP